MAIWKTGKAVADAPRVPVLFLDRDGVVIEDRDYLADPAGVTVLPGAAKAMLRAREAGYLLVGVSNQSGIGRGYFSIADFEAVMERLQADLIREGAAYDGFFYCPHGPDDECSCRKPRLGLLDEAAGAFNWDPERSWVIGDKASDVALGQAAGLGSILVRTGYGAADEAKVGSRWPGKNRVLVAADLAAAVDMILDPATDSPGATPNSAAP